MGNRGIKEPGIRGIGEPGNLGTVKTGIKEPKNTGTVLPGNQGILIIEDLFTFYVFFPISRFLNFSGNRGIGESESQEIEESMNW